jgi:hypothetical protein
MKPLFILSLALVPWFLVAVVACAACGSIGWAFTFAFLVVLCLFVASREWDAIKNDREWQEATRPGWRG